MKPSMLLFVLLLALGLMAACTTPPVPAAPVALDPSPAAPVALDPSPATPVALDPSPAAFDDPFAYCAAVGSIDVPDSRYTGEQPPAAVIAGLRTALDAPADAPDDFFKQGTFWRCADGQVKACMVGANLPCQEQADLSETPNEGTVAFCKENPNADGVPAAATGRATVFIWSCADGAPVKGEQVFQADAQGFIADFWYLIEPPPAATAPAAGAYRPLPADACAALKAEAEGALGVSFSMAEAPFFDYLSQEGGSGCQLTATGTGVDFDSPIAVVDALKTVFAGWQEEMLYAAGGPTGAGIGMTRDDALLLIMAHWTPDPAANCPVDQPISACELTPEQRLYTVTIQAATK